MTKLATTPEEALALEYHWPFWARPAQLPPSGDWTGWLILAGRGFGKTRTAMEWARKRAEKMPGCRGALVGRTAADVRDVLVEGESGILAVSPPWFMPVYEPSKRRGPGPTAAWQRCTARTSRTYWQVGLSITGRWRMMLRLRGVSRRRGTCS